MKKSAKIGIYGGILVLGFVLLASCTASFCSPNDQAHMLYAFDNGVTIYTDEKTAYPLVIYDNNNTYNVEGVYCKYSFDNSQGLTATAKSAATSGISGIIYDSTNNKIKDPDPIICPSNWGYLQYYAYIDNLLLVKELDALDSNWRGKDSQIIKNYMFNVEGSGKQIGFRLGNLKYVNGKADSTLWDQWADLNASATTWSYNLNGNYDSVPSTDFRALYKTTMNSFISQYRSCLTTINGYYGTYGEKKQAIWIENKSYGYSWNRGFFEGLLVWPIGSFIDVLAMSFGAANAVNGVPQILAIIVVTVVIRFIMSAVTFKSTLTNARMTDLQPEIQKIQGKYPNANTNQYEKQRMAQEMQGLYKKNRINPFSTILVMIVQFPIFICVWGALSGSSILTSGTFFGLDLSASISSVLFNTTNWTAAGNYSAVTAFILFLLMALSQVVSMLLPQWIQKQKAKNAPKLGKNPAQNSQSNKMKWFTYIMTAMIIFMGFSLVSAMGIYWLIGALFSIAQTLLTTYIVDQKKKKRS